MLFSEFGSIELIVVLCVVLKAKEAVTAGLNSIGGSGAFRFIRLSSQPNHMSRWSFCVPKSRKATRGIVGVNIYGNTSCGMKNRMTDMINVTTE